MKKQTGLCVTCNERVPLDPAHTCPYKQTTATSRMADKGIIDEISMVEAITLLNRPTRTREEIISMIATLAKMNGDTTYLSKMLPKGMVVVGDGESFLDKTLKITPEL